MSAAREAARAGDDISPGSKSFWDLIHNLLTTATEAVELVQQEVAVEQTAPQSRVCVVCTGPVYKRHAKGRWPIYCDTCSLADR